MKDILQEVVYDTVPYGIDPAVFFPVTVVVALLVLGRIHASDRWWCPELAWFWWPLRSVLWPLFDKALEPVPVLFARSRVPERELVARLDITLEELHADVAALGGEAQPLSSKARDWLGRRERSSLAIYHGPKPLGLDGLPEWTRRYQIHIRPFGPDGILWVTAHHEYNPWVPWLAVPHVLGIGLDSERGVRLAAEKLGIDIEGEDGGGAGGEEADT